MRLDLANTVNTGDVVYNCFMQPCVVKHKTVDYDDDISPHWIHFVVTDPNHNTQNYSFKDVYLENLEDEDDAEKSWVEWAKNNQDFFDSFDHIETSKEIYRTAFYNGFEHKQRHSYEEQMQK